MAKLAVGNQDQLTAENGASEKHGLFSYSWHNAKMAFEHITAGQIVGRVRLELMQRFGMVLSEEGTPLHDPVWEVFTPEAEELNGAGTFKVHMAECATGGLDNSPPDRKRHFEYNRKELPEASPGE